MTAIIQKLRRKRKLSSELHSRWGDVSITYPNGGSWSQWDQSSTGATSASPDHERRHGSLELNRSATAPRLGSYSRIGDANVRAPSVDSAMTIPTGHYDARLSRMRRKNQQQSPPVGVSKVLDSPRECDNASCSDDSSEDEEDDVAVPAPLNVSRDHNPAEKEEADSYSQASKSPPLSVTSRMRSRHSAQRHTIDPPMSAPGTAGSKHTSYSSSVPSNPSDDQRPQGHRLSTQHDRKSVRRPKPEPLSLPTQPEMVPSYDELYG
ncbi:hypothetical protein AtubIFM55763_006678 [Aspergillus tubingensis]|uniref:Uncharacterized protein n=2 Tax=Aspergillus tubingensis TaxID=5068 RepID=A0A1L9MW95_ASPTC|nr:hypothetical protein ASPTUDRAFT_193199 [Aspergillus tubingensis CBS 134.48]GLA75402.1 hypothetical protein AtubIFM55763_006678 [Aspergillus tubingensis]GLA82297.1 hypothetical protein AtubIFM56815_006481 [Aspergillus tubingensis]GLA97093.1 hypothetical protein AtubIFM57143_004579 [Aspergillus tubingensis]GLB18537.1 hypothetical protein AtubIFM61612_008433 [Aspergillus tubingensis]